jgi:hypothetical protein
VLVKRSATYSSLRSNAIRTSRSFLAWWQLRDNFSANDATYLALAEVLASSPTLHDGCHFARAIETGCPAMLGPRSHRIPSSN